MIYPGTIGGIICPYDSHESAIPGSTTNGTAGIIFSNVSSIDSTTIFVPDPICLLLDCVRKILQNCESSKERGKVFSI
jgi:hypothetical protein